MEGTGHQLGMVVMVVVCLQGVKGLAWGLAQGKAPHTVQGTHGENLTSMGHAPAGTNRRAVVRLVARAAGRVQGAGRVGTTGRGVVDTGMCDAAGAVGAAAAAGACARTSIRQGAARRVIRVTSCILGTSVVRLDQSWAPTATCATDGVSESA